MERSVYLGKKREGEGGGEREGSNILQIKNNSPRGEWVVLVVKDPHPNLEVPGSSLNNCKCSINPLPQWNSVGGLLK